MYEPLSTMTDLIEFPYSAHDEPSEDWTIENLLQWCLLQSNLKMNAKSEELVNLLQEQFKAGKAELWAAYDEAQLNHNGGVADFETNTIEMEQNEENADPLSVVEQEKSVAETQQEEKDADAAAVKTIHVELTSGPYEGTKYALEPRPRQPCFVGRSAGKKFRDKGISLPKDGEVSTTHGKFEVKGGKAYFKDTGSTNGTLWKGKELEVNVPYELESGMELMVGVSMFKITLGY